MIEVGLRESSQCVLGRNMVIQHLEALGFVGDAVEDLARVAEVRHYDVETGESVRRRLSVLDRLESRDRKAFPNGPRGAESIRTFSMIQHDVRRHRDTRR